ncbi:hypothetical protein BEWA_020330 [Theileria equi strain WA]|uniref:Uncharacterized protein n=1 Tax=Theileria equi strain WA TaxID=1537102 RepID=L0AU65_THEEQ|nr:hypothetical protein BEWA_020330 [Theileria equi strain WA]AFZ79187.1 hypothetical protein BEWA_020330 [Theileria equi strain WA]|eukprot:XP_004828853.1 hypothetical protein BEWA_020330 [Theileria equi strain WA]
MALKNKAAEPCEGLTPKAKGPQIAKDADLKQSSPSPLKFRSFEAFYKHYSQKQSHDQVSQLKSSPQMCKYKVTVIDKGECAKGNIPSNIADDMEPLVIRTSDKHKDLLDSSRAAQPSKQPILESEYFKGRVKRICQIFQKAHDDSNYREALQQAILKKKRSKVTSSRRANNTHFAEKKSATPSKLVPPEDKKAGKLEQGHTITADTPRNIPSQRDHIPRSKPSIHPPATPGSKITKVQPLKLEESALDPTVLLDDNPEHFGKRTWLKHTTPSPKAGSPVKQKINYPLAFDTSTLLTSVAEEQDILEDDDSHTVEQGANENLIEDILSRFLTDPTFGENFINLLEGINSFSESDINHISQILNDLDFLVENDESDPGSPYKVNEENNQTAFGWFFNKPQVFDINLTDRTEAEIPEQLEQIPEDLRINNAGQFKWINEI